MEEYLPSIIRPYGIFGSRYRVNKLGMRLHWIRWVLASLVFVPMIWTIYSGHRFGWALYLYDAILFISIILLGRLLVRNGRRVD
jgi:hypothetical protein